MDLPSKRPLILLAIGIALLAIIEIGFFRWLLPQDNRLGDRFVRQHAATLQADTDIVIIDIDESSLAQMSGIVGKWPWPRSVHAELLELLSPQQPAAVVFDLLFTDEDVYRPQDDAYLNEVLQTLDNVYLPMLRLAGDAENDAERGIPLAEFQALLGAVAGTNADPQAKIALALPAAIDPATWRVGTINFVEDDDGVGRRYDIWSEAYGWRLPSLPTRVAQDLGFPVPDLSNIVLEWKGTVPAFERFPYIEVYEQLATAAADGIEPGITFRDKIIIIGTTAPGLHDLRKTPIDSIHPGVEILATAIDNLKQQSTLRHVPAVLPVLAALLPLLLIAWLFIANRNPLKIGLLLLGLSIIFIFGSRLAISSGWLIPVVSALLFVWVYYFAAALYEYVLERRAKELTIREFKRTMDPRVVERMIDTGQTRESLSGQSSEVTVLFSDIRGFTTMSETHAPEEIVALLNRYFSLQVDVIFRNGGTLDKFIGDAIMAFWGAPQADPEHANRAVRAAMEMTAALKQFQAEIADTGLEFDIGIGLHSGPAVVGFIGSEHRKDYTAIGDCVNLASRIEGLTKGMARVLISEQTREQCDQQFDFVDRGSYKVKGRQQEVRLYEPAYKT